MVTIDLNFNVQLVIFEQKICLITAFLYKTDKLAPVGEPRFAAIFQLGNQFARTVYSLIENSTTSENFPRFRPTASSKKACARAITLAPRRGL